MTYQEMKQMLDKIYSDIRFLIKRSGFEEYEQMDVDDSPTGTEGNFMIRRFNDILYDLNSAKVKLEYIAKPVSQEGILRMNNQGRYEIDNHVFTCGCSLEAYLYDNIHDEYRWIKSRMEAHDGKYYIVGYDGTPDGVKVRVRW